MLGEIRSSFAAAGVTDIRVTAGKGDERGLAAGAIAEGCTTIVSAGGDGTSSNIATAIVSSGSDVRLAVLPGGTGNDFAKTLGTHTARVTDVARLSVMPSDTRVDVGVVEDHVFLNSCGFGFDVAVLEQIGRSSRLRGNAVYVYAALRQLLTYSGVPIALESRASEETRALHLMLVIANAPNFGGAFRIAPTASVTDGLLDAVSVLDVRSRNRVAILAAATRGTHIRFPEVMLEKSSRFTVTFGAPPRYQCDGELHRAESASISVRCLPAALRVVTGERGLVLPRV